MLPKAEFPVVSLLTSPPGPICKEVGTNTHTHTHTPDPSLWLRADGQPASAFCSLQLSIKNSFLADSFLPALLDAPGGVTVHLGGEDCAFSWLSPLQGSTGFSLEHCHYAAIESLDLELWFLPRDGGP